MPPQDTGPEPRMCSICQTEIGAEGDAHTLPCNHCFHTSCIIQWFRSENSHGTCPECRQTEPNQLSFPDIQQRCTALRRYSRRKNAPPALKKLVLQLKNAEESLAEGKRTLREHRREHQPAITQLHTLRRRNFSKCHSIRKIKRKIAYYHHESVPVPFISSYPLTRNRFFRF